MPVPVAADDQDTAVGVENILAEYRSLPEETRLLHIFHGVGHSPNITAPDKFAEVLDQFVTGVVSGGM